MNHGNAVREFTWDDAIEFVDSLEFDNERFNELVAVVQQRGNPEHRPLETRDNNTLHAEPRAAWLLEAMIFAAAR